MARYIYGSTDPVAWSQFKDWSNNISTNSNVSIATAKGDMYPVQSAPWAASTLRGSTIWYGSIHGQATGTGYVSVSAPYTVGNTTGTINIKNIFLNSYNLTIVATATYPYTFHSWRTAANGGGTSLSTSSSLTITNAAGVADYVNIYAYFTTTHITP